MMNKFEVLEFLENMLADYGTGWCFDEYKVGITSDGMIQLWLEREPGQNDREIEED